MQLAKRCDRLVLGITVQVEGLDTSDQDGFHVSEQSVDMDQIDIDLALLGWGVGVNTSDIFEVLDHAFIVRVLEQTSKVTTEHVLSELDLLCILGQFADILDDGAVGGEAFMTLGHGVPGDIKLVQLCVDGVDDGGDQRLNEGSGGLDGSNVILTKVHELGNILETVDGVLVELGAVDVLHGCVSFFVLVVVRGKCCLGCRWKQKNKGGDARNEKDAVCVGWKC